MAYKAIVARIHTRPLPGSDNIVLGTCCSYQVIVGKDTPDGALGVFFEQGGQLSEEFCQVHDLVRRKNEDGSRGGGYFEENRRVKAVKLRGAKSEGFWCPLSYLEYTGYDLSQLREGDQFEELNGHPICRKYVTPATARQARQAKNNRAETPMFPRHEETEAFRRAVHLIPAGAILYFTEKLHGTSFRYGHVLEEVITKRTLLERLRLRLSAWLGGFQWITKTEWVHLNGSRNVILERRPADEPGYYGKEAFRYRATERIRLHKGEVLYGELVGYTDTGAPIMAPQSTEGLKDKELLQRFGKEIVYRYGCIPGQCDLYVYRITMSNEDGQAVDLSWPQVVARCRELGLKAVPPAIDRDTGAPAPPQFYDGDVEKLTELVGRLTGDGHASGVDPSHLQEGIVVRYESEHGTGWLKSKAWSFGVLEGYLKEQDDYVDTEEAA